MTGYFFVQLWYSIFYVCYKDIRTSPTYERPIGFATNQKLEILRLSVGIPVLVSFVLAFTIISWPKVLLYTLVLRIGIFFLVTGVYQLNRIVHRNIGLALLVGSVMTIIALLYYFLFELIL